MNGELELTTRQAAIERVRAIVGRTDTDEPAEAELVELRSLLMGEYQLWRLAGDLTELAIITLVGEIREAGGIVVAESVACGVEEIRRGLGYEHSSAIERILIEQVALSWLRLGKAEHFYSTVMIHEGVSTALATYIEKRLTATQRRFLRAVSVLARVRKITSQTVQINIATAGGQQINVQNTEVA